MVKIKRIAMAFVFLLSQVSLANGGSVKKGDAFNYLPLSAMILSEERIANLSDEDKLVYLRAIIYLGQVLEASQAQKFDYESPVKYESEKTSGLDIVPSKSRSMFSLYWNLLVSESKAVIGAVAGWVLNGVRWGGSKIATTSLRTIEAAKTPVSVVASAASKAKSGITNAAVEGYAKRLAAAEASGVALKVTAVESAIVKAGLKPADIRAVATQIGSKDGLKTAIITKLKDVKVLEAEREVARAAGNLKEVKKLDGQILKARTEITKTEAKYYTAGGKPSDVATIYRKSNTTLGHRMLSSVGEVATISYLGYYMGYWGNPQIKLEDKKIRDSLAAVDANKDPGKIIREHGYSCIYGGRPSTLVRTDAGVLCGMPTEGQNDSCNVNNGDFQCPNYGFSTAAGSIDKDLCIKIDPKKNLTVNCVAKFNEVIEAAGDVIIKEGDEKKLLEFNDGLRGILVKLEGDIMTDVENKTHSFGYYCENSKKAQKSECNALSAFVNTLKERPEIKKAIVAQAEAPPVAAGSASGSSSASSAPAGQPPKMPPMETREAGQAK
ncbi:MAG: hypothetical protein JNM24_01915 [Bdellovibrionaceae bacterium]|nr:hypothetical protein [Pseudobdellovibrionaceae bacterium]